MHVELNYFHSVKVYRVSIRILVSSCQEIAYQCGVLSIKILYLKNEKEARTLGVCLVELHLGTESVGYDAADVQSESGALHVVVQLLISLEDVLRHLRRYARAGVGYREGESARVSVVERCRCISPCTVCLQALVRKLTSTCCMRLLSDVMK